MRGSGAKWLLAALFTIALAVSSLLFLAFAAPGILEARADDSRTEEGIWYTVSEDGAELTVSLPDRSPSHMWKYGISERGVLQMTDRIDEFHKWTVVFTASGKAADVTMTFHYLIDYDTKPDDSRTLEVSVDGDGKISVPEGEGEDTD